VIIQPKGSNERGFNNTQKYSVRKAGA